MTRRIDLSEIRIKIDQLDEAIVSTLKHRSRFPLNHGVFSKIFVEGMTWLNYRLKREQDVDAEFGRYLYPDQDPFLFRTEELSSPIVLRSPLEIEGLKAVTIDRSAQIISDYQWILRQICEDADDESSYGEVVKLDVQNLLFWNERVIGIGRQVAEYKLKHEPALASCSTEAEIKRYLVKPERETEVVLSGIAAAKRFEIKNSAAIGELMKRLICITTSAEVEYILKKLR